MKYVFSAEISAGIDLPTPEFDFIMKNCRRHYDSAVQESASPGGFLWGSHNERHHFKSENIRIWVSNRQLQRLIKAIEFNYEPMAMTLKQNFFEMLKEMSDRQIIENEKTEAESYDTQI